MSKDPMAACARGIIEEAYAQLRVIRVEDEWRRFRQETRFHMAMEEYERANPYWRPRETYEARFKACLRSEIQHFGRKVTTRVGQVILRYYPVAMPTGNGMAYYPWDLLTPGQVRVQAMMRNVRGQTELAQRDFALILSEEMDKAKAKKASEVLDTAIGVFADVWGKYDPASVYAEGTRQRFPLTS